MDLEIFLLISGISGFSFVAIEHIRKRGIHGKFYSYCFLTWDFFQTKFIVSWNLVKYLWFLWNFPSFPWFPAFPAIPANQPGCIMGLKRNFSPAQVKEIRDTHEKTEILEIQNLMKFFNKYNRENIWQPENGEHSFKERNGGFEIVNAVLFWYNWRSWNEGITSLRFQWWKY